MRILYALTDPPCPPTTGGRQRSFLQLQALREIADLHVALLPEGALKPEEAAETQRLFGPISVIPPRPAGRLAPWNLARWTWPRFFDRLAGALDPRYPALALDEQERQAFDHIVRDFRPDLCFARYFHAANRTGVSSHPPAMIDLDDLDTEYLKQSIREPGTPAWRKLVTRARLRHLESRFRPELSRFSGILLASPEDLPHAAGLPVAIAPNIPFINQGRGRDPLPPDPDSSQILIVATLGYLPNIHGLDRFLTRAWPEIIARRPDATLNIVGGGLRAAERERWNRIPGIHITGFVDSLEAQYARAAFAIAPIYLGGGTKIKVLEALAYGRTCVVTPDAHRGYQRSLPHGEALLRAGTDAEFADCCVQLLADTSLRDRLAANGHAAVSTQYTYPHLRNTLHAEVAKALGNQTGRKNAL